MPIIGSLVSAINCISVARPQDQEREKGSGVLTEVQGHFIKGEDTQFTNLTVGSTIYIDGCPDLKVKNILSDTEV